MWISRKEYNTLLDRLMLLEQWRDNQSPAKPESFTAYGGYVNEYGIRVIDRWTPSMEITVKDAVQKILTHLGLRLNYVEGEPERVDLEPIAKKAKEGRK